MARSSASARKNRDVLLTWTETFQELVGLCQSDNGWSGLPTWYPQRGQEGRVRALGGALDRTAGVAARVMEDTGIAAEWKPPGTMAHHRISPILTWTSIFDDMPQTSPDIILTCCNRALGILEADIAEAEEHENTLEGRIAAAASRPRALLLAVRGAPRASAHHPSAFWAGVVGTIVSGLVVGYLLHLFGWV